jgi:hypothetical protein
LSEPLARRDLHGFSLAEIVRVGGSLRLEQVYVNRPAVASPAFHSINAAASL